MYRVGSPINTTASGAIQFFNTNVHTWSLGPRLVMTKLDSVALVYQQSLINQSQAQTRPTRRPEVRRLIQIHNR